LQIADEIKRLAAAADVASIIDMRRVTASLENWPESQPSEDDSGHNFLLVAIPQALGAAYFIENVTGTNYSR
jgi:hypothetical protein